MPTRPAARPPNACDSAVRCGTAVSGTRDSGTPTANPATIASTIHAWWMIVGSAQVASTARTVPAMPAYTPFRAVAGVFIQCSAKMKHADATRYANWPTPYDHERLPPSRLSLVLNIFSMRSVIRKPLTMLVIEAKSAMAPSTRMRSG